MSMYEDDTWRDNQSLHIHQPKPTKLEKLVERMGTWIISGGLKDLTMSKKDSQFSIWVFFTIDQIFANSSPTNTRGRPDIMG